MMLTNSSGSMTAFRASRTVSSAIGIILPLVAIILPGQGRRLIVAEPDQDLLADHLHFVRFGCFRSRHRESCAGLHVKLRPVARTSDCPLLRIERPITQRPAVMCTDIVERVPAPGGVNQDYQSLTNFDQQLAWIRHVTSFGYRNKVGHLKKWFSSQNPNSN